MKPLVGLPRTAMIKGKWFKIVVENHQVVNKCGLMAAMMDMISGDYHGQKRSLQMKSQGFKLDAVIEECIKNIRDPKIFSQILWRINGYKDNDVALIQNGMPIARYIENRVRATKNWRSLYSMMSRQSPFVKHMLKAEPAEIVA